jgi:hypothetical protein
MATLFKASMTTERSISENLEIIKNWARQAQQPAQSPGIMSNIRTVIIISFPMMFVLFLGYLLTQSAQSGPEGYCACPDGGVRSTISRHKLAA